MNELEFKRLLVTRGLDLISNRVGQHLEEWYRDELEKLTVKQYIDDDFMEDWREQRRIETYNLIEELRKDIIRCLESSTKTGVKE